MKWKLFASEVLLVKSVYIFISKFYIRLQGWSHFLLWIIFPDVIGNYVLESFTWWHNAMSRLWLRVPTRAILLLPCAFCHLLFLILWVTRWRQIITRLLLNPTSENSVSLEVINISAKLKDVCRIQKQSLRTRDSIRYIKRSD